MNLALYREFRPKTFSEVIGQNHITRTLSNQVKNKLITHAYLFTGTRGTGKTSCAKIFSKAINCLSNVDGSPCGQCEVCKALNMPNTDVVEIDAASNNRVDEIRDLREKVKYLPTIANKKVYIIDEVHMLTESAFNALLKTLEEPPEHIVFILATTEVHKLPATILSRCTRFDFRLLTVEELVEHLQLVFAKRNIKCDKDSLYLIAQQGEGSVRDTLSIADSVSAFCEQNITYDKCLDVLGLSSGEGISSLVDSIIKGDIKGIFTEVTNILNRGKNITLLCKEMTEYFKNVLLIKSGVSDLNTLNLMPSELELMKTQADKLDYDVLKLAFDKFARIELELKYSINAQNLFEAVCISLTSKTNTTNVEKIINSQTQPTPQPNQQAANEKVQAAPQQLNQMPSGIGQSINNPLNNSEISGLQSESIDINKLWGTVLIKIKEKNMFALSACLRDVYGVQMIGNCLVLKTNDKSVQKMIDEQGRIDVILSIASSINPDIKRVEMQYDESNKVGKDLVADLKNVFMDKLRIKE